MGSPVWRNPTDNALGVPRRGALVMRPPLLFLFRLAKPGLVAVSGSVERVSTCLTAGCSVLRVQRDSPAG